MTTNEYDIGAPPAPQPLSPNEAHNLAENLAAAGLPPEQIREQLRARGADPDKAITPADEAQWRLTQLKADPIFAAKVNSGDSEANALLNKLTAQIALGKKFSPVAETAKPEDYKFNLQRLPEGELQQRMQSETAQWAAELKLPGNVAASIVESVLDNAQRTEGFSPDARVNQGEHELAQLRSVLAKSGDPEAALKEAQKALKLHSGRDIDIAAVARTSGASVALELALHARALAYAASR